ncbi:AAA family ATPase [Bergeyella sp. RCAD1439]|uniref:AAA family ATPase n=1 Tax=Bergeyella anatis TaxID=3113737 RepID=UPI002E175E40|nr:AAA family ATPase [Bergeyella sp. RCAD1439]
MENKYEQLLFSCAKELDKRSDNNGDFFRLTSRIISTDDKLATKKVFKLISIIVNSNDEGLVNLSKEYNDLLLRYFGFQKLKEIYAPETDESKPTEEYSLEELLFQLDQLTGLQNVKDIIKNLISFQKVQQLRRKLGFVNPKNTLHLAFIGNPGTGKTTVARIVGKMYKELGLLSKGHFIEVSRTDLIAGYQGQTALKVKKVIEKAKGGVLFIDEAYSITENEHSDSYGRECLTELTKALEDYRDDLVVIVAGYSEPMEVFFNSNPGLKSRFNTFIEFDDYSDNELVEILLNFIKTNDYSIDDNTTICLKEKIAESSTKSNNARFIRNIFDNLILEHAKRVSELEMPSPKELQEIIESDITHLFTSKVD